MSAELWLEGVILEFKDNTPCNRAIIRRVMTNKVIIADILNGKTYELELEQLNHRNNESLITFLANSQSLGDLTFIDLTEKEQRETNRKYRYIKGLLAANITKITLKSASSIIAEVSKELGEKPPHWQSVRGWYKCYEDAGNRMRGLYPRHRLKGDRQTKIDPRVLSIIRREAKRYLKGSQPTVASIHRNVECKVIEHNLNNPTDSLSVPNYLTVRDRLLETSYEKRHSTRQGKNSFQAQLARNESGIESTRILERVEIDHTLLDLNVLHDEHKTLIGKPIITVLIDHYSHMVLGFQLSFEKPSFAAVSMACKNAFLPKDELLNELGNVGPWPAHGIPSTLVTDNGNEFWGKSFATTADELGSIFQYCPIRRGNYKSRVERFFGIVNSLVLDDLPGVARKPSKCAEGYDARQEARMTYSEFKRHFVIWLTEVYHNLPLEGSGMTPNELWNRSEADFPVPEEKSMELLPILMSSDTRTLSKGGISKFSLSYDSSILKDLYRRDGAREVGIKYNPFDIGYILVLDDLNKIYIKAKCDRYPYASGLSLFEHDQIRHRAKRVAKDKFENPDLLRAKVQLANERDELHKRNKRRKTQVSAANAARSDKIGFDNIKVVVDNSKKVVHINCDTESEGLDLDGWGIE